MRFVPCYDAIQDPFFETCQTHKFSQETLVAKTLAQGEMAIDELMNEM